MGPSQVLPPKVRVAFGVVAIKGPSIFARTPLLGVLTPQQEKHSNLKPINKGEDPLR